MCHKVFFSLSQKLQGTRVMDAFENVNTPSRPNTHIFPSIKDGSGLKTCLTLSTEQLCSVQPLLADA